jgi:hypothetical protein
MPDPEVKSELPKPDPKALTPEYHKARKQVMLWAGILFVWELIGIDLEQVKKAGGYTGALITAIKSPQAVPWVLFILVAYFLFKTTVEWHQCSAARRNLRISQIDFRSAWIISLIAYALYIVQSIIHIQFADIFGNWGTFFWGIFSVFNWGTLFSIFLGLMTGVAIGWTHFALKRPMSQGGWLSILSGPIIVMICIGTWFWFSEALDLGWKTGLVAVVCGLVAVFGIGRMLAY